MTFVVSKLPHPSKEREHYFSETLNGPLFSISSSAELNFLCKIMNLLTSCPVLTPDLSRVSHQQLKACNQSRLCFTAMLTRTKGTWKICWGGTNILIIQLTFRETYLNIFDGYVIVHMQFWLVCLGNASMQCFPSFHHSSFPSTPSLCPVNFYLF